MRYNGQVHLTRLRKNPAPTLPENILIEAKKTDGFKQLMNKNLGNNLFIFSMIIILLGGIGFFITLHFFVNPQQNPMTETSYQPVTTNPVSLTLNLSSPDDNILVFDSNLLVSGQSTPGNLILVMVNDNNQILNSSKEGSFSLTVKLKSGSNQIIVSAFDNQGNYKIEERLIYYSEEKL